jgi:hypothetical protein
MNDDTTAKPNVSGTTCRIGPPADDRFDEEAFLLREIAEARAAMRRTVGVVKKHAGRELKPQRLLKRHPLAAAGAVGLSGIWIVRRILRFKSGRGRPQPAAAAPPAQKTGLLAMLIPSIVAIVQSLTAAKVAGAQSPANPQAWMAKTLWGLARDRFRGPTPPPNTPPASGPASPTNGLKAVGSRTPVAEPTHRRRVRPK